jgi:hypothetical protein
LRSGAPPGAALSGFSVLCSSGRRSGSGSALTPLSLVTSVEGDRFRAPSRFGSKFGGRRLEPSLLFFAIPAS